MANATGITYNEAWTSYGLTQDLWDSMNATQQTAISVAMNYNLSNYAQNASSLNMQDAVKEALKDPAIIGKYVDAYGVDKESFTQSLGDLQTKISTENRSQQSKFEQDRKALALQHAQAGEAYSGFRQQAQKELGLSENAVVVSSRAGYQKSLNDMTASFESKYGTNGVPFNSVNMNYPQATSNTTISGTLQPSNNAQTTLTGKVAGGITGSQVLNKQADVNSEAANNIKLTTPVAIKPVTA